MSIWGKSENVEFFAQKNGKGLACVFSGGKNRRSRNFTRFALYVKEVKTNAAVHLVPSCHLPELRSEPPVPNQLHSINDAGLGGRMETFYSWIWIKVHVLSSWLNLTSGQRCWCEVYPESGFIWDYSGPGGQKAHASNQIYTQVFFNTNLIISTIYINKCNINRHLTTGIKLG